MDTRAEYDARIARWADHLTTTTLTDDQAQGWACVKCGHNQMTDPEKRPFFVAGFGPVAQVFVRDRCDGQS